MTDRDLAFLTVLDASDIPPLKEAGRKLFAAECGFIAGANSLDALPPEALPEVAFIGRSNVGKSSLINALTGRKALARTSQTPGRTQQLNFFELGGRMWLIDLPGYGYAKVSKDKVKAWTSMMRSYLRGRVMLNRVHVLIDARHGLKEADRDMMRLLDEAGVAYRVILTKVDKARPKELEASISETEAALKTHAAAFPVVLPTSAETGEGVEILRASIAAIQM